MSERENELMKPIKSNAPSGTSVESLKQLSDDCIQRVQALQRVSISMISFLKEVPMNITEMDAEDFNARLDRITADILEDGTGAVAERTVMEHTPFIFRFIGRQKENMRDKETEYKNIIAFLRNNMTGLIGDTQRFNSRICDQSVKMEAITQLDDIRKIKEALKVEVAEMNKIIQEKRASDNQRIEALSKEIAELRASLEEVKDASLIDAMTGAYNRKAFNTRIKWVMKKNSIVYSPTSLMMCDLDNFKQINDKYGHIVGDRVLHCFVQECKAMFRSDDLIVRYGGEEFAILLSGISHGGALNKAQSFCRLLSLKQFVADPQTPDVRISFTVSIGVSELRREDTPDAFIDRADKALYIAKRTGKNRAVGEVEN
jgi:diguanylate cyclase